MQTRKTQIFKGLVKSCLLGALVTGCATQEKQLEYQATGGILVFVEPYDAVTCRNRAACAIALDNSCIIYMTLPRTWRDYQRDAILGHELKHCLGARPEHG